MPTPPDISRMQLKPIKVTFLEMHEKPEKIALKDETHFKILEKPINVDDYRHLYYSVGEKYFWLDRMVMEDEKLSGLINADNIDIIAMYINGDVAGYAEFKKEEKFTEIIYFGLMPAFIGKGLGKYFLDWAIQHAWTYNPEWVRLDTCELDHPHALSNYKKRGFKEVRTEIQDRKVII